MTVGRIDFASINAAALVSFEGLLAEWLPDGQRVHGEWKARNPLRADSRVGSFSVSITKGVWKDFATDDGGADPVSLYAYLFTNGDQGAAGRAVADRLGMGEAVQTSAPRPAHSVPAPVEKPVKLAWRPVLPVPAGTEAPPRAHPHRGLPEAVWCYRNADGAVLGYVYRFRTSEGGKEVLPLTWCDHDKRKPEWHWMQFPEPRPLYGLDRLAAKPDAVVLVVEGEKCADAAVRAFPEMVVISWPGGGKAPGKADWLPMRGRRAVLWADCDAQREKTTKAEVEAGIDPASKPLLPADKQPGTKTMHEVGELLLGLDCKVWWVTIPAPGEKPGGWDVADAIAEGMPGDALVTMVKSAKRFAPAPASKGGEAVQEASKGAPTPSDAGAGTPEWMRGMIWKARGVLEDCRENVFLLLTQHPAWQGVLGFDEFARRVTIRRQPPIRAELGEWTGECDLELGLWMAQQVRYLVKGEGTLTAGVSMAASRAKFHPVREYLEGLTAWDGVDRCSAWLEECMGAEAGSPNYLALVGRLFLIGMVARVMEPGCKWDYLPIFEGKQGKGKSTALRVLAGEWFADTQLKIGDKDAYMQLEGVWLYEIGEMDAFNRAEATAVKAFVTTQKDRYREPYARRLIERLRQVAFAGTTNQREYLKDPTGNRRYWPVHCSDRIDLEKLAQWRDQLFAEALYRYRNGEVWRPSRDEEARYIFPEQEAREIVDPWMYELQDYLDAPERRHYLNEITGLDLLRHAIGMDVEKIDNTRSAATRIGNLMAKMGWDKRRRPTGRREWVYVRPQEAPVEASCPAQQVAPAQAGKGVEAGFSGPDEALSW